MSEPVDLRQPRLNPEHPVEKAFLRWKATPQARWCEQYIKPSSDVSAETILHTIFLAGWWAKRDFNRG